MKLKYKLLLAAMVICLIIITAIFILSSSQKNNRIATVLSTEPIKSHRLIETENCSVIGVLEGFSQEYLSRYHPAQNECKMFFLIETLQTNGFPPPVEKKYRNCVVTQKVEQIVVGYDVVYRIGNILGKVRAPYDPGLFIPLDSDGRLKLTASSGQMCENARNNVDALVPFYCVKLDEPNGNSLNKVVEIYPGKNTYAYFE
ncbi:UmoD family flagellar biogenesis regulator [Providencia manganoxydans]|uniref:UmoD family flagellar biogenesis regulator n=1 Tax=Providencia manganoxydans TaxID=2923283 RepID=UPI0034DD2DF8